MEGTVFMANRGGDQIARGRAHECLQGVRRLDLGVHNLLGKDGGQGLQKYLAHNLCHDLGVHNLIVVRDYRGTSRIRNRLQGYLARKKPV